MKKLFIDSKGQPVLIEVKDPHIINKGSIVKTNYALISSGTELIALQMIIEANKPLIRRFLTSKEFRKNLFFEIKKTTLKSMIELFKSFYKKDNTKNFSNPSIKLSSIGYSCSGVVQESNLDNFKKNDKIACGGSNHAELIYSPKNLSCRVPDNVSLEEAAFATLGAIALQGIHRADIKPGEYVGIIGTGLIGLITVQLAKVSRARVLAFDLINKRLNLAKLLGADYIANPMQHNTKNLVNKITDGKGLDSIIICASSKSQKLLNDATDLIRDKGKIVMLGLFPISVDRDKIYSKEVDLLISRSYGPGRYDPYYEYEGFDYPKKYVTWTEQRNMEHFLKLISEKKVNVKSLISDIIPAHEATSAYSKLQEDPINNIAILIKFSNNKEIIDIKQDNLIKKEKKEKLIIGLIGCGSFAQNTHLPYIIPNQNCKIRAISTNHKKTSEFCRINYHPDYVTTNYQKILKDPKIDTVFIYTRHNTHAKIAIEALKAGKNVFSEKPMGLTKEECKNVYNAAKETGKNYSIGFNRRFSPFVQISKELLKERTNPFIINYRIASSYLPGNIWIFDPKVGGGPIIGEFCHFTDLILYLMNSEPEELYSSGGNLSHKNIDSFDNCTVIINFKDGSIANLIYTDLNAPDMPKERIEIYSGESAIFIDDFKEMKTSGFNNGNRRLSFQDKGHKHELDHIIKTFSDNSRPLVNENDAIKAMDLCFKTIQSIKERRCIKINSEFYE